MTDNRTNGQIVAKALDEVWNFSTFSDAMEAAEVATSSLAAASRLAGQPTQARVEAAANALRADTLLCHMDESPVPFETLARAALVAAAGVAPQAESEYAYCPIHGDGLGGSNRSDRCASAPSGHEYAAPAQPSSTVDEDALAEVIASAGDEWQFRFDMYRSETGSDPGPKADFVARAVAEWLKEQGR